VTSVTLRYHDAWIDGLGCFRLRSVSAPTDGTQLTSWLNATHVRSLYHLDGFSRDDDGRYGRDDVSCYLSVISRSPSVRALIGEVEGTPVSYWEFYQVTEIPELLSHVPSSSWGVHVLVGDVSWTGRGWGGSFIRAAVDAVCYREGAQAVVSEPNIMNTRAVRAFESAGFVRVVEMDLPSKRAQIMIKHTGSSCT